MNMTKKEYNYNQSLVNNFSEMPPVEEMETVEQMEPTADNETISPFKGVVFHPKKSTKSERIQLMLTPELKAAIKKEAKKNKTSVNELINVVMKAYVEAANDKK